LNAKKRFIVSASDFSLPANDAAMVAAKLALRRGEKVVLLHVTDSTRASVRSMLANRLAAEADRLRETGVEVEAVVVEAANRSEGLVSFIRRKGPSLVVVGGGRKGPMDRWALGSFSEAVAESSPVPTLVIRNPAGFESWDWTKGRLSILLALDFYASSDAVLRWAKQFQLAGPCDLVACHVNWRMPAAGEPVIDSRATNSETVQQALERDLQKKVRDQIGDDSVEIIVRPYFGDPGQKVVEIATENKTQLIAVGTHQRHGLQRLAQFSVSRDVLHQALTNVVCVPLTTQFDAREAHIPEYRRVLVATDFSALGNSAVPFAFAACSIGGVVRMIHVTPPRGAKPRAASRAATNQREQLRALIPNEAGARCRPPEVEVMSGRDVAEAICAEAERFGADVVCLASHGLGASRALHGSVTKAVLKRVRRPLLVVRRPEE
jgi:nucleotide-binding universal stress UspA family protein